MCYEHMHVHVYLSVHVRCVCVCVFVCVCVLCVCECMHTSAFLQYIANILSGTYYILGTGPFAKPKSPITAKFFHSPNIRSAKNGTYTLLVLYIIRYEFSLTALQTVSPIPSNVQGVTVTRTVQGSSPALRVSWSAVSGSGITYTVCYSTTSGTQSDPPSKANCGTSGITGTSTTLGPLSRGTTYYIWVAAVSSGERGPYSDRRQSITYNRKKMSV